MFLTAHYGRAKSAQSLTAGLPYDENNMGPDLFCEAASRIGLKTAITKKTKLSDIPAAVLPAVIILDKNQACVLIETRGKHAKIFWPETGETARTEIMKLSKDYSGYAIYIHPRTESNNIEAAHLDDTSRHWFWGIVRENRRTYALALLGAVFINLFGLASPLFIMNVYDRVIPNNAIETGWALGIGALVVFVFDFILRNLRAYLVDLAGRRIDVVAARRIYDQVLDMKLAGRPPSSGIFANMLRDFDSVRDFFTSATITALVDLPFTIFFLFIIYQLGGPIAFILGGLILATFLAGLILQAPLKSLVKKSVKSSEAKHGLLIETIQGLETVKSIGADGRFRKNYGAHAAESATYGQSSRFVSGLGVNIATFLQQTASVIVVLAGMYLVQDGSLTVGGLIACVILGGRAIAPIGQIANLMTRYHHAGGALKTLDNIMTQPIERPLTKQFLSRPDLKGEIAFRKVCFAYPNTKELVLDDVTFKINAGEKIGIIGRIGSGKSTIARLLLGLYDADRGTILADNTDYRQIDPADLRRNMAYIAQDVMLFNGTVRDNITASLPGATDDQILTASKAAGVHDFISRHPMGYDAPVGEHGARLSGGQRQAIALARAILRNPKIYICDEPTNAMDSQAENTFIEYMAKQADDATFILITHKPHLLKMVDRLILMDHGRVMADGPRDDVLKALQSNTEKNEGAV